MRFEKWNRLVAWAERMKDISRQRRRWNRNSTRRPKGHSRAPNRLRSWFSNNMTGGMAIEGARVGCCTNIHQFTSMLNCTFTFYWFVRSGYRFYQIGTISEGATHTTICRVVLHSCSVGGGLNGIHLKNIYWHSGHSICLYAMLSAVTFPVCERQSNPTSIAWRCWTRLYQLSNAPEIDDSIFGRKAPY